MKILKLVAIAILIAVLLTLLSVVPPLSILYKWAERNHLKFIWYGLIAGIIALCLTFYRSKR